MRISKITATAIVASLCGSLTLGVVGVAGAVTHAPARAAVMAEAAAVDASDVTAKLENMRSIGARLTQEAQAQSPDMNLLKQLQIEFKTASDQLAASVEAAGGSQASSVDAWSDFKTQLDQVVKDVDELVAAVLARDLTKVGTVVSTVVADLQAIVLLVPKLVGELPLQAPVPATQPEQGVAPNTPDASAPDASAPDASAPEVTAPDASAPEVTAPDASAPEVAAPDASATQNLETAVSTG